MNRRSRVASALPMLGLLTALAAPAAVADDRSGLEWHPCARAITPRTGCSTMRVPRSYAHPGRGRIHLAIVRHRASDPDRRVGTLFFNPGGPGCCPTSFVPEAVKLELFPRAIEARFDIVSWDPRGVGESTAVQCFQSPRRESRFLDGLPEGFPVGRRQKRTWVRLFRKFGRRCRRANGALLRHVSTAETARDLNRLRRALGAGRMNYLGISYGTFLGATYANLFPDRVRAMVLDGNVNPRSWIHRRRRIDRGAFLGTELRLRSDLGTKRTLNAFLDLCGRASADDCAFSAGTPAATQAKLNRLLRRLRRHPARYGTSYAALVSYVASALETVRPIGQSPGWAGLALTLEHLWTRAQPNVARATTSRMSPGFATVFAGRATRAAYEGPEQQYAIYCSESPNPRPAAFWLQSRIGFERSGAVGRYWSWLPEPCGSWPARAADRYTGPWDRPTPNPVLVVGNTHDPSTPYRESKAMATLLAKARLLTVAGYGHTELTNPSSCAGRYESRYLIDLALPPPRTRCRQDYLPFSGGR